VKLASPRLRAAIAVAVGLGLLYSAFELGRSLSGYSAVSAFSQRQALSRRIDALTRERDRLAARVAAGDVTRQVDQEAQSEAQAMIGGLQAELARQQQELDFYRGLVAERFGTGTIKVQQLTIRPEDGRRYAVSVTLVQTATRDATARGTITLAVDGSRGGALTQLSLEEISVEGSREVGFTLRYFRTVEIPIELPEDFTPAAVRIEFRSDRSGPEPVRESFPWQPALDSGAADALTGEAGAE